MSAPLPVALTCGEPAGIGPELAVKAWQALKTDLPFFLIGDPAHLPANSEFVTIDTPDQTAAACATGLPVLPHHFRAANTAGQPAAENASAVISAISRGVDLVQNKFIEEGVVIVDEELRTIIYSPKDTYRVMHAVGCDLDEMFEVAMDRVEKHIDEVYARLT